jgi:hypothetical protein
MADLKKDIGIKSFLDKLDKYRENNIILLEILNTSEEYLGECLRENKINHLLDSLCKQTKENLISHNVYKRLKEYVDFATVNIL